MKNIFVVLVIFLSALQSLAEGGGVHIGSGGVSVQCQGSVKVCRKYGTEEVCVKRKFKNAVALDYFAALMSANEAQLQYLNSWSTLNYKQTMDRFFLPFKGMDLYEQLQSVYQNDFKGCFYVQNNWLLHIAATTDASLPFVAPKNCRYQQTINRSDDGSMLCDRTSMENLSKNNLASQQAVLMFHELLYQYAHTKRAHANSARVQALIMHFLLGPVDSARLQVLLKRYNFID